MRYHCTSCGHRFEHPDDPRKVRCPSCMRRSSVVEDEAPEGAGHGRIIAIALGAVLLLGGAAAAAVVLWPSPEQVDGTQATPTAETAPTFPTTDGLPPHLKTAHARVASHEGAREAARSLLGRSSDPTRAMRGLARYLQRELAAGNIFLALDASERLRRGTLSADVLTDGLWTAMLAREGVYLHPAELTWLTSAALQAGGVSHHIVLLEPEERALERVPVPAVAVTDGERTAALDPYTGALRTVLDANASGAPLLHAELALIDARRALRQGDVESARSTLARADALAPETWTVRAVGVRLALADGDVARAGELAEGLADAGDHPIAWLAAARAVRAVARDEATADTESAEQAYTQRLREIVDAFPLEATLAVELGNRLRNAGDVDAAAEAFREALRRRPEARGAHTGLGWLYASVDRARALGHFRDELAAHPSHLDAYLGLARLHLMYGDREDASRVRERAMVFAANARESFAARFDALEASYDDR